MQCDSEEVVVYISRVTAPREGTYDRYSKTTPQDILLKFVSTFSILNYGQTDGLAENIIRQKLARRAKNNNHYNHHQIIRNYCRCE
jgi:antirestriction protein ArdC